MNPFRHDEEEPFLLQDAQSSNLMASGTFTMSFPIPARDSFTNLAGAQSEGQNIRLVSACGPDNSIQYPPRVTAQDRPLVLIGHSCQEHLSDLLRHIQEVAI